MKFFLFTIFLLFSQALFSQKNKLDSLLNLLKNSREDTSRAILYYKLGECCDYFSKYDSMILFSNEGKKLSTKLKFKRGEAHAEKIAGDYNVHIGNYNEAVKHLNEAEKIYQAISDLDGLSNVYVSIGNIDVERGNYDKGLDSYFKSLKISEKIKDDIGIISTLSKIGIVYENKANYKEALIYYKKQLDLAIKLKYRIEIASAYNNIGLVYRYQGNYPEALECCFKSLKIQEELKNKFGIATLYNNIAIVYSFQGSHNDALNYFSKSLKMKEEIGDKKEIADAYNNLGIAYKNLNKITEAISSQLKALRIREALGNKYGMCQSYNNIGNLYSLQRNYLFALDYYEKSLKLDIEIGDKYGIVSGESNIGNAFLNLRRFNEAKKHQLEALKISLEIGAKEKIKDAYRGLSSTDSAMGNYKTAFDNYKMYILYRDSLFSEENTRQTVEQQMQYEFDKKAAADSVANAKAQEIKDVEIEKQNAEIKAKRNQQYALFGGLILVIVFAWFMYNRFKITNRQKIIIEEQKSLVEEKHKEITDSINYAERIQRSFIATKQILDENLKDYFVVFKPKDVVSGDFYWAAKLHNDKFALVTADSTGHGVPGAIMSLLNITSLEKAIESYVKPSDILNSTRKTIIERLKKDGSEEGGKDGMDASLCVFDFKNKIVTISAANNPVWIVKNSGTEAIEVLEVKPDKMPLGKHDKQDVPFSQQEIDLQSGDVVYTLTDGFPDQFGGEKGKKFMSKKLRELLASNAHLPMNEQKLLLENVFKKWIGNMEQVDDVTVIGVRI